MTIAPPTIPIQPLNISIRLLKRLTLVIAFLPLLACTTHRQPVKPAEPFQTNEWQTRLHGKQGSVTILFNLSPQAKAHFELLSNKKVDENTYNIIAADISLYNQNCAVGHMTGVNYFTNGSIFSQYFTKETPWNNTNSITLTWDEQQLSVTVNDEAITVTPERKIKTLRITSTTAPINIEQVQYNTITK